MSGPFPPGDDQRPTLTFNYHDYTDDHFVYQRCLYKGYALIINNEEFTCSAVSGKHRRGSNYDREGFRKALLHLGFLPHHIRVEDNKTAKEIRTILRDVSKMDFTDHGCIIVAIFSYGDEFKVFGTDDRIAYNELISPFNFRQAPSLFDKPKWFIVQSEMISSSRLQNDGLPSSVASNVITEPDVLFVYSLDEEDIAWKTGRKGTCFIQSLIEVLNVDGAKLDVMQMMTRVNHVVRQMYESQVMCNTASAKCPYICSLLSKTFKIW